jgi:hypothetical protein
MSDPFDTGAYFVSKDGKNLPRNSQFAIVALRATRDELGGLAKIVRDSKLLHIVYVQEMIDMIDDEELAQKLNTVETKEMNILGIGIFGPKDELKNLTGALKLWK